MAAIDYGLKSIQSSDRNRPQVPAALLVQARVAARNAVGLDTVLRRYFAGYALLGDFIIEEAEVNGVLAGAQLKRLLRAQASIFDRLLAEVSEEHARETEARHRPADERRAELVRRLLAGEHLDASELAYDLEATHVGLVAEGFGAAEAIREIAAGLDRRLLLVRQGEDTVWAWFGGWHAVDREELPDLISRAWPQGVSLALGEPGEGIGGWRLTHRQACAGLPIAQHVSEPFVRYADVALLASILKDELLATSLREIYLAPLEAERDGGKAARETLRSYLTTGRNITSAAAALGVNRNTVANRLRSIEEAIGRPLDAWAAELEAVLKLEELHSPGS